MNFLSVVFLSVSFNQKSIKPSVIKWLPSDDERKIRGYLKFELVPESPRVTIRLK